MSPKQTPSQPCDYCHDAADRSVRLLLPREPGQPVHICARCLRTLLLRKADLSQRRNGLLLDAFAEQNGVKVWCSQDVGYALPPVPASARHVATH